MRKLTLDVNRIAVESFPTADRGHEIPGTVRANEATVHNCAVSSFTSCRAELRDACTCPPPP
ncbi:MAG TPA: hypothetical protein VF771_00890 [Longimicrobiaceae bacterium]